MSNAATDALDSALARVLARIGADRSTRRIRSLGGAARLMASCGYSAPDGALHLRAWLRRHP